MQQFLHHWGYLALVLLTVAEAASIPIPSEVTVGYAGFLASTGRLNLVVIIVLAAFLFLRWRHMRAERGGDASASTPWRPESTGADLPSATGSVEAR